ncbi:MAG: thermonuclease family protein [Pseudomonadota bacterium]
MSSANGWHFRRTSLVLATCLLAAPATAQEIRVIDGDTFEMDGEVIRLSGLAGFEPDQSCWGMEGHRFNGQTAMDHLRELLASRPDCVVIREGDDGIPEANCYGEGGLDLGLEMARDGLAWADPADGTYGLHGTVLLAEARGKGIWGEGVYCLPPWIWSAYGENFDFSEDINLIDGDTFRMNCQVIRLWGIDALNSGQTCMVRGTETTWPSDLATLSLGFWLQHLSSCETIEADEVGIAVGRCVASDGSDIGQALVELGAALVDPEINHPPYLAAQLVAQEAGDGYWGERWNCSPPWEWRERN